MNGAWWRFWLIPVAILDSDRVHPFQLKLQCLTQNDRTLKISLQSLSITTSMPCSRFFAATIFNSTLLKRYSFNHSSHISNVILDLELFWLSVGLNFQSWPIFSPSASRCFLWSHDLLHRSKRDPASRCLHPPDQPHFSRRSDSKEILKSGGEKYIQPLWTNAVGHIWEILHELKKMDPASSCLPSRRKCFYWSLANFRDKSGEALKK